MDDSSKINENQQEHEYYKTVNQLAQEYGMTKNGIMLRIKKMLEEVTKSGEVESDYITKGKRNTIYVKSKGLVWLANWNDANTPMQSPSYNSEVIELQQEHARQEIHDLEEQRAELKKTIEFLQSELIAKTNQINGLTATVAQQAKIIDSQTAQFLAITENKSVNAASDTATGEHAENENAVNNAPQAPNSHVSISDEQITAELSKRSFLTKIKLLFSK